MFAMSITLSVVLIKANFLWVLLASNICMYGSVLLFSEGLCRFYKHPFNYKYYTTTFISFSLIYAYYLYIDYSMNARILIFAIFVTTAYGHMALVSYRTKRPYKTCFFGRILTISSLIFAMRAPLALYASKLPKVYGPNHSDALPVLLSIIHVLLLTFGLMILFQDRMASDMRATICEKDLLVKDLETQANTDLLTQLFNRRKIALEIKAAITGTQSFALMMLDLDYFKTINDTYGHNTGDLVLVAFSELLEEHLRDKAIISRWGGEEFLVLLPHMGIDEAYKQAEAIREHVACQTFAGLDDHSLTTSIGLVAYKPGHTVESIVQTVDKLLYQAKDKGRNQTIMA